MKKCHGFILSWFFHLWPGVEKGVDISSHCDTITLGQSRFQH